MAQSILEEAKKFYANAMQLDNGRPKLTTSTLRDFLNDVVKISNEVEVLKAKLKGSSEELPEDIQNNIDFLDVKLMYKVGRETDRSHPLKDFYNNGNMSELIKKARKSISDYERFANLMEAIVALHKYHGGRE